MTTTKIDRAVHANTLIKIIASHGRRFFYSESKNQYARIELDERGRVWFIDYYTGKRIYTHRSGHWNGFTSGGTLKSLVEDMRDYITFGMRIAPWKIAPPRENGSNIWGYPAEAAEAVRKAALALPIIAPTNVD
ncbi:TPA: hypothetical protein ACU967_002267 [Burkholderia contaminans]|uniref:hypothetical protein n=1 Tax=Burkholderia contaminans TaxID=488447 RepID=UPI000CFF04A2|nr:hypothetical protein [Burkholderia contaminans]HDR9065509.1 hypothetical protein [Burkholderia vietnamiensis]MBM6427948.1 hypothetical protein [Burkholderia contaminans]MCA7876779.1 hypothetical protein [Burkholderia contaminans]MDN8024198.1 hypothetical protein [Burkholderia contaminans]PRG12197.1 hypothetical protein C6Q17_14155 [Burkholderia contaminans]